MTSSGRCAVLIAGALFAWAAASTGQAATPVYGYRIVHTYPHDQTAFTEGLFWQDGYLYESTGLEGRSFIRKEAPGDGEGPPVAHRPVPNTSVRGSWRGRIG